MHSNLLKKICNIILDILIGIFSVILIVTIYNDIQVKAFNKDYADFFGYTTFEVQTGSMVPAVNINDLVIVKIDKSPKLNDIITYKKGNSFITHRVVEAYKETYVTKGDANNTKDDAIKKDQIVGKVIKVIPNFGTMRKTLLNPIVLITLIATVFIISKLFGKPKKVKEKKEEKEEEPIAEIIPEETTQEESTEPPKPTGNKFNFVDIQDIDIDDEKTIYFRKISVDSKDLNPEPPVLIEEETTEPIVVEEVNEEEEEKKIETLRQKHKKFDTVVEKAVFIKEEELNEIINLLDDAKLKTNEPTIKDKFIKVYIDAKYYNHCGNINLDYNNKNICSKLEELLNTESDRIIKEYQGTDTKYQEKVLKYKTLFIVLTHIEQINKTEEVIDEKASAYEKKITKYLELEPKKTNKIIKAILKIQKMYEKIMNDTLESVESNTFELHYNQLNTNKNIYGLVLGHNISFSKVYSSYIISKTYDEGIVAEDKVLVILNILLSKIASDMMSGNFKNKYLLYLPATLYEKETKLNHILKLLEDEFVKNSILILVKSSVIVKKEKIFRNIKKLGYQVAIVYDNNETNNSVYAIATYLFVDKKVGDNVRFDVIDSEKIIYEDLLTKVDLPGGDE